MRNYLFKFCVSAAFLAATAGPLRGAVALVMLADAPVSQSVTLAWDPSPDSTVVGYFLYYGPASDNCTNRLDAGNSTSATLSGLQPGVAFYFNVTAYDATGQESPPSNEISYTLPVKAPQAPLVFQLPATQPYGAVLPLSVSGGSGSGAVTYTVLSGSGTISNGNILSITAPSGTVMIQASKAGDNDYLEADTNAMVSATQAAQAPLTFSLPDSLPYGSTNFLLAGGGSGAGAVTFSVTSGPGLILNGNSLVVTSGGGTINLQVTKAQDDNYTAASSVVVATAVKAPQQACSLALASPLSYGSTNVLSVTGGSGAGSLTYSVTSGPGVILDGNKLVITSGTGVIGVQATKAADDNYLSASATATVAAGKAAQASLALTSAGSMVFGTTNNLSATGGSGTGDLTYSVTSGPGLIIGGSNLVITAGSGVVTLQVSKAQDENYMAATATAVVSVTKASQTVTFSPIPNQTVTNTVTLAASASSGLPVSFHLVSGPATLSGNQLAFSAVGSVSVAACQNGDAFYNSAPERTNTLTITWPAPAAPKNLRVTVLPN